MYKPPLKLVFVVEGESEINFVKGVLGPYLREKSENKDFCCEPIKAGGKLADLETAFRRVYEGKFNYPNYLVTSMIDFCHNAGGISEDGTPHQRAQRLEDLIQKEKYATKLGERFLPHCSVYELEALLFVGPEEVFEQAGLKKERNKPSREKVLKKFQWDPEKINRQKKPSKYFEEIYKYSKATEFPILTKKIGIDAMRKECEHFDFWVTLLIKKIQELK